MKIVLGSQNPYKVQALEQACNIMQMDDCQIVAVALSTKDWDQQPVGFEQTLEYARTRALALRANHLDAMCMGIESGLLRSQGVTIDMAVIAAIMPDGKLFCTTSPGLQFPETLVQEAKKRGFKQTTVGQVIAEKFRGDPKDPHQLITNQQLDRRWTLCNGVYCLLLHLRGLDLL